MKRPWLWWHVYGPPLYSVTRLEIAAPYIQLSIELSPAIGAGVMLDRRGLILSLGLFVYVRLNVNFPK